MFFLYVIAHLGEDESFNGPVKIGVSNDLPRRLKEIQTGNPVKLGLYASVPFENEESAYKAERCLHENNKDESLQGEWFNIEPERVMEDFFWQSDLDKKIISQLNNHIKHLESEIDFLKITLWEQEKVLEGFFRDELKDKNDRIFDKYSIMMSTKYKELVSLINGLRSGKTKDDVFFGEPYWMNLAKR